MTTTITGAGSLAPGASSTYTVSVATAGTGANTLHLGMAIASSTAGTPLTKISLPLTAQGSGELIHASGTSALATLSGGAASYQFTYAVPSTGTGGTTQTLYAVARVGLGQLNGAWAHANNFNVTVPAVAPTLGTAFGAGTMALNGTTSLTITITNPAANGVSLSSVAFTDSLPAGLVVATPNGLNNTCGGTPTAVAGASSFSLSAGSVATNSSCTITVNVTGTTAGVKNNSVQVTSTQGTSNISNASVTVIGPPVIIKAFGAASIPLGGSTSLTFTVQNNNTTQSLSGVGFSDTLPAGLVVATPNGLTGSCGGGTITATAGSGSVGLSGATLAASSSCNFSVNVTGTTAGTKNNITGSVTSTQGGTGGTAAASLNVIAPPSIAMAFNPTAINVSGTSAMTLTITNPAANAVALTGVAVDDTLPSGLVVATPNGLSNTCGGTPTAVAGSGSVSLTGGSIVTGGSCAVTVNVTSASAGTYPNTTGTVSSTNGGTGGTANATLTVAGVPGAPTGVTAAPGPAQAIVSFTPPASNGGSAITGYTATCTPVAAGTAGTATGTASPITVSGLTVGAAYTCTVKATNSVGDSLPSTPSNTVTAGKLNQTISFTSTAPSNAIVFGPAYVVSATATSGLAVSFTIDAAASSICTINGASVSFVGAGVCTIVANQAGNATYNAAPQATQSFAVTSANVTPRLVNISTRMQVLTGDDVLIGGFIIGGSGPKTVVVRARGPSLVPLGVANALANPKMDLYSGQTVIASNDDWQQATNAALIQSSGFAPADPLESAILVTLDPGAYTAVVSGVNNGTGVGIIEVFEVDKPDIPLINISTRGRVLTGSDVMIGGFIIQGNAPQTVIVRARGPSLADFGIATPLANPVLQLFSGQTVIASNDNWQAAPNAPTIQALGFAPASPFESVILISLPPGAYTAIVTGAGGTTGVGIIEVFAQ